MVASVVVPLGHLRKDVCAQVLCEADTKDLEILETNLEQGKQILGKQSI